MIVKIIIILIICFLVFNYIHIYNTGSNVVRYFYTTLSKINCKKYENIPTTDKIDFIQKNNIAIIQKKYNDTSSKYCARYSIDYINFSDNIDKYKSINTVFMNSSYEYVIFLESFMKIIDKNKTFNRLIDQAGDVDMILFRDIDKKNINMNTIIFRRSEWTLYKLRQLYWNKIITTDIILDQIYTTYKPLDFSSLRVKLSLNNGIPYNLSGICIYNEHSSFVRDTRDTRDTRDIIYSYPWVNIPNYQEINCRWSEKNIYLSPLNNVNKIEKFLFQTMETTLLSTEIIKSIEKWRTLNPSFSYIYFSTLDQKKFIKKYFSTRVQKAYDKLLPGAYKADFWRCCVLYIYGGVYTDIRTVPLVSLDEIIEKSDEFIIPIDMSPCFLWNGFMCAKSRHPILKNNIKYMCKLVLSNDYGDNILDITGPSCMGKIVNKFLKRDELSIYTEGKINSTIKLLTHSIFSRPFLTLKNKKIILTKCKVSDNKFAIMSGKEKYCDAWLNSRVYKNKLI